MAVGRKTREKFLSAIGKLKQKQKINEAVIGKEMQEKEQTSECGVHKRRRYLQRSP